MNMLQGIGSLILWIAALNFVVWGGIFGLLALFASPHIGLFILFLVYIVGKNMKF